MVTTMIAIGSVVFTLVALFSYMFNWNNRVSVSWSDTTTQISGEEEARRLAKEYGLPFYEEGTIVVVGNCCPEKGIHHEHDRIEFLKEMGWWTGL